MKHRERSKAGTHSLAFYEVILAVLIVACIAAPQLVGTTTVPDPSQGHDENGCPTATTTFEDLQAPGTRFGTITVKEWQEAIQRRFPEAEVRHYSSLSNTYIGLPSPIPGWPTSPSPSQPPTSASACGRTSGATPSFASLTSTFRSSRRAARTTR